MSKHLRELQSTLTDILRISPPINIDKLVSYILQWYETKSLTKLRTSKIPIMTETLSKKTQIVIKAMKLIAKHWDEPMTIRLQQRIQKTIIMINKSCHMKKKQAPAIPWSIIKKIYLQLWDDISVDRGSNIQAIRLRKAAATALALSNLGGSRWIDLHRIHWEDLMFSKSGNIKFVQAPLRMSKNNICNDFPQSLTWASSTEKDPTDCPWEIFRKWWVWNGKPKKGFVFADGKKKQISGDVTIYHAQARAKKMGLPNHHIPRKHTGRVTTVLTLEQLNVSKRRIMRNMNWRSDQMVNYYMNRRDMLTKQAPPSVLAKTPIQKIIKIQKNLR